MQPDSKPQTSYPPGKKPAAAVAMGPRLNSNSVRHHHHHSRSKQPSLSRSHTTAGTLSRSSSCHFRSAAPPAPAPAPATSPAAAAARLPQHTRSHTTAGTLSRSCSSSHLFRSAAPPPPAAAAAAAARPSPQHARSQSTPAMGETTTTTTTTTTTVLVGRSRQPFIVDRRLLCAASPFFRDQLQMPNRYASSSSSPRSDGLLTYRPVTLWLPGESTTMFGLFVEWLHAPRSFRSYLDDTAAAAAAATRDPLSPSYLPSSSSSASPAQLLHWAIVRLHLFAAHLGLAPLQDLAMDALQDLYLCCDWDISPAVVTYLYTRCEARPAARLRRWAVAMMAFSLAVADWHATSSSDADTRLRGLIGALPELAADYATHVRSMRRAALDMRFKNPQLRIPANALRNEKRAFGFRECSFHSHRRAVGQGACPHGASGLRRAETGSRLDLRTDEDDEEGAEDDEDDDDTRQWEKEWADEFLGWEWEEEGEDACVPTTSLRRPPRKAASRGLIEKGKDGGGGSARLLMSKFGSYRAKCPLRKLSSRDSNLLSASV
ncbi:hypothetical protein MY3296_005287 [Beauveria thailandica]